jgi:hypothetical protein
LLSPKEYQKGSYVDTAGIERKKMSLPGEVSTTTSWLSREVSRSHSTYRKRGGNNPYGLTSKEGRNVILPEIREGALNFRYWVTESLENL